MGLHERVWVCSKCGRVSEEDFKVAHINWRGGLYVYCWGDGIEIDTHHKGKGTLKTEGPIEVVWPKGVPRDVARRMQGPC